MECIVPYMTQAEKQQFANTFYKFLGGQWVSAKSEISENALSYKVTFPTTPSQGQDLLQQG